MHRTRPLLLAPFVVLAAWCGAGCESEVKAPTADAGPDVSVNTGTVVRLDGSGSADPAGRLLTYAWRFLSVPDGSRATLNDPTLAVPSFVPDVPGDFEIGLAVSNGLKSSGIDTVTVEVGSGRPTARIGTPPSVNTGVAVSLSGEQSSDPDDHPIFYRWSFASLPVGSQAELLGEETVSPSFVPDLDGDYVVRLVVDDGSFGNESEPDTAVVTVGSGAPTAVILPAGTVGANQGSAVLLDGRSSTDPDQHELFYDWSFVSMPAGSVAILAGADSGTPSFVPDVAGTYVVRLVVDDGPFGNVSTAVTKTVSAGSCLPVASFTADSSVTVEDEATRLQSTSTSPCARSLTPTWQIVSLPVGSFSELFGATTETPTIFPDAPGSYVLRLRVVDSAGIQSDPASLTVTASPRTVDAATTGVHSSMALDAAGNAHVSYWDSGEGDLKYARFNGSAWTVEVVDTTNSVGSYNSIGLNAATGELPRIAYLDSTNKALRYAERSSGGTWTTIEVDGADSEDGDYASLALDPTTGFPRVLYRAENGGDRFLKYAFCNATCTNPANWTKTTVAATGGLDLGGGARLALTSGGVPRFVYLNETINDLFFGSCTDATCGTPSSVLVDASAGGSETALALNASNNPRIVYFGTGGNAKYATCDATCTTTPTWAIQTIDSTGDTGHSPTLALGPDQEPRAAWVNVTTAMVRFGTASAGSWSIADLTGGLTSERSLSLKLTTNGNPRLSYHSSALKLSVYRKGN